jgi:DNA-binding NarL/FixJ family response regulator
MIVDDHAVVRRGLAQLLATTDDLCLAGEAGDGETAIGLAADLHPDVVLMDLSMPAMDGIRAIAGILAVRPGTHIVVLTSFSDQVRILDALHAGAEGYLLKHAEPETILSGIREVVAGGSPLDPKAAHRAEPHRPRAGGAAVGRRGPAEQVHRPPAGYHRANRQGPSDQRLPAIGRHRPDPGRAVGPTAGGDTRTSGP